MVRSVNGKKLAADIRKQVFQRVWLMATESRVALCFGVYECLFIGFHVVYVGLRVENETRYFVKYLYFNQKPSW